MALTLTTVPPVDICMTVLKGDFKFACSKLICRHEPLLSGTTDADEKFPEKKTKYTIDGEEYDGVFSVDLTLKQIKTLRAIQPNALRDPNYNGTFKVGLLVLMHVYISPCALNHDH
jgi:hypothetical protein